MNSKDPRHDLPGEQEAFDEVSARDKAMLASIGDGLVATDKDGTITLANEAFRKIFDLSELEVNGKALFDVLHAVDESGKKISWSEHPMSKLLNGESTATTTATTTYERKDGTFVPVAFTATPILAGPLLVVIGAIGIFRDITKEKELDRLKSEFISIASHQLRTPLTGIQWVVERFTKKETLTEKGKEYLNDIHLSAKHLTELVDTLLNLSRIESGKVEVKPEPLEVVNFVRSFLAEVTPLRDKKELQIIFNDHPIELSVKTDKSALRNIVQSIISNAIEYTPERGKITVGVQKKENTFVIMVADTGIGVPKAAQAHIFEKFVRADNAKLYKTDGTGIGLYATERATSLLGGKIWFISEENEGSTFFVELPLEVSPKA